MDAQNGAPNPSDDHLAIQDVMVRYAAGLDERDFDAYRTCFMDDVELIGFARESVHGIEAWLRFVAEALAPYRATQHMLGVPRIVIDGERASMRTDLQASHFPKNADAKTFILWATYETELQRTASGWRIERHRLVPRAQKLDGDIA